jgi:hypothetical protein
MENKICEMKRPNPVFHSYTQKKKSSGVDNWYLDEFFEEDDIFIWSIRYIIYVGRLSWWLSSLAVENNLLWTIISYVV